MSSRAVTTSIALIALALVAGSAQAADGWFSGIHVAPWVTRNDALLNLDRGDPPGPGARKSRNANPAAPSTRRVDVELSYMEGGAPDPVVNPARAAQSSGRDFRVAGVGVWTLNDKFGVTGRVGAYHGDVDGSTLYRLTPEDSSLHPTFGMGLRYDLSSNLRLQGGWDRYHLGQSLRAGDDGVDLLSIGLKYRF